MNHPNLYRHLDQVEVHSIAHTMHNGVEAVRIIFLDEVQREIFIESIEAVDNIGNYDMDVLDEVNGFDASAIIIW